MRVVVVAAVAAVAAAVAMAGFASSAAASAQCTDAAYIRADDAATKSYLRATRYAQAHAWLASITANLKAYRTVLGAQIPCSQQLRRIRTALLKMLVRQAWATHARATGDTVTANYWMDIALKWADRYTALWEEYLS